MSDSIRLREKFLPFLENILFLIQNIKDLVLYFSPALHEIDMNKKQVGIFLMGMVTAAVLGFGLFGTSNFVVHAGGGGLQQILRNSEKELQKRVSKLEELAETPEEQDVLAELKAWQDEARLLQRSGSQSMRVLIARHKRFRGNAKIKLQELLAKADKIIENASDQSGDNNDQ